MKCQGDPVNQLTAPRLEKLLGRGPQDFLTTRFSKSLIGKFQLRRGEPRPARQPDPGTQTRDQSPRVHNQIHHCAECDSTQDDQKSLPRGRDKKATRPGTQQQTHSLNLTPLSEAGTLSLPSPVLIPRDLSFLVQEFLFHTRDRKMPQELLSHTSCSSSLIPPPTQHGTRLVAPTERFKTVSVQTH